MFSHQMDIPPFIYNWEYTLATLGHVSKLMPFTYTGKAKPVGAAYSISYRSILLVSLFWQSEENPEKIIMLKHPQIFAAGH